MLKVTYFFFITPPTHESMTAVLYFKAFYWFNFALPLSSTPLCVILITLIVSLQPLQKQRDRAQ